MFIDTLLNSLYREEKYAKRDRGTDGNAYTQVLNRLTKIGG